MEVISHETPVFYQKKLGNRSRCLQTDFISSGSEITESL